MLFEIVCGKAGFVFAVLDFAFLNEYWVSYCRSAFGFR